MKRDSDGSVPIRESVPNKVLNHTIILILPCTVVHMQVHFLFSKAMLLKEKGNMAHYSSSPLATLACFVRQRVDLPW